MSRAWKQRQFEVNILVKTTRVHESYKITIHRHTDLCSFALPHANRARSSWMRFCTWSPPKHVASSHCTQATLLYHCPCQVLWPAYSQTEDVTIHELRSREHPSRIIEYVKLFRHIQSAQILTLIPSSLLTFYQEEPVQLYMSQLENGIFPTGRRAFSVKRNSPRCWKSRATSIIVVYINSGHNRYISPFANDLVL